MARAHPRHQLAARLIQSGIYLVDTGPLVALLDRGEPAHERVRAAWEPLRGRFVTTAAVITESMHFLCEAPGGPASLADGLAKGHVSIVDTFQLGAVQQAAALMDRYADVPMDFADATLVILAERLNAARILTLDERGFRTFRFGRNRPFRLAIQDGD
jgi:predicted nucleic acid-binding protein